jgi:broad specificity polyphosphatase/5'/3'-nucleotidase SurE
MAVFLLLLFGMFIPILEKGYEAIVVQLIKCVYNMKEMSITECCIAIVGFLAVIPSMLAALIGMDAGDGLLETFVDEGINAAADVAEEAAAIAAVMNNLLFNIRQKYAASKINVPTKKRHGKKQRAATKVQSNARGHQVRTRQRWRGAGKKDLAAILIQRAFLTKRNLKREGVSLRKVQINQIRYRTALKSRVGVGSHWTNVGPEKPTAGSEIFSKRLAAALRTKQEFSNEEVAAFEVLLRIDSFIKVDEQYFEQVRSAGSSSVGGGQTAASVSKATGSLTTGTDSRPPPKQRICTSRRGRQAKRRMSGQAEYGSLSSFGFSAPSSPNSKQPPGRSLLADMHARIEPAAETATVEPVATAAAAVEPAVPSSASPAVEAAMEEAPREAAAREASAREAAARGDLAFLAFVADPKATAAADSAALLGGGVVSERDISLFNFGTLDASRDSIISSKGLSLNSTHPQGQVRRCAEGSVGAAAGALIHTGPEVATSSVEMRPGMQWLIESMNRTALMIAADEDENDEDGMSVDWPEQHPDRNKAVDERVTRARASLPRGLPKSVPRIFSVAKSLRTLPPGLPPTSSSSSEPEKNDFVDHV